MVRQFCNPASPVRILLTTDVAAQGLNLHFAARYLFHLDIPWNPARMEQRIGRLDRFGQPRGVFSFHFTSSQAEELRFLSRIARKVVRMRDDLGTLGEILAGQVRERLTRIPLSEPGPGAGQTRLLEVGGQSPPELSPPPIGICADAAAPRLAAGTTKLLETLQFSEASVCETLATALAVRTPRSEVVGPDEQGLIRLVGLNGSVGREVAALITGRAQAQEGSLVLPPLRPRPPGLAEHRRRASGEDPEQCPVLHPGHPLWPWAAQWLGEGYTLPWSLFTARLPPPLEAAMLLVLRVVALNPLGHRLHAGLVPRVVPLARERGNWVPEVAPCFLRPEEDSRRFSPEVDPWSLVRPILQPGAPPAPADPESLRQCVDSCFPHLVFLADRVREEQTRVISGLAQRASRRAEERVAGQFHRRRLELFRLNNSPALRGLRRELAGLRTRLHRRGFLLADLQREHQAQVERLEAEVTRRREGLEAAAALVEQGEELTKNRAAARFVLAGPVEVRPAALAILLSSAASFTREVVS